MKRIFALLMTAILLMAQQSLAVVMVGFGGSAPSAMYTDALAIYDFAAGSVAADTKGNYSGTAQGGATTVSSKATGAYSATSLALTSSSSQYISVSHNSTLSLAGTDYSVAFRVKYASGEGPVITKSTGESGWRVTRFYDGTRSAWANCITDTWSNRYVNPPVAVTTDWETVVIIFDNTAKTATFYITSDGGTFGDIANGSSYSQNYTVNANTASLTIGYDGTYYFDGYLGELVIWARKLSSSEASAYTAGGWR